MEPSDLRIALVAGNYNYVRDGATQALNRLVDYLLRRGANVRIYSPTIDEPAFEPAGEMVNVPSMPIPGRPEYRLPLTLSPAVRRDLAEFAPNVVHIASPDIASHRAVTWARRRQVAAVASVHTRFETYLAYYHMEFLEPAVRAILREAPREGDLSVFTAGLAAQPGPGAAGGVQRVQLTAVQVADAGERGGLEPFGAGQHRPQPLERFALVAAIVFSDILVVPLAMGLGVSFGPGEGPRIAHPLRSGADYDAWQLDGVIGRIDIISSHSAEKPRTMLALGVLLSTNCFTATCCMRHRPRCTAR